MSSFLSRPPYSWFLSVSIFSCRLFPFNNKMNPVTEQRITFPKPILHLFSYCFSESSAERSGKQSFLHILMCFSYLSFSSGNSQGTFPSLHPPQASCLIALPSSSSKTVPLWIRSSQPKNPLALQISINQLQGQTETYTDMGGFWEQVWMWIKMTWRARCSFGTNNYDRWLDSRGLIYIRLHPHPQAASECSLIVSIFWFLVLKQQSS